MSKLTNNELIFITLGVVGIGYFFYKKNGQKLSADGSNEVTENQVNSSEIASELSEKNIVVRMKSFLPQDYPLIQVGMMEAILEDINRIIKEKGVDEAIKYCQEMYILYKKNQPTEVQKMKMKFYRDIANNIKKQQNG